MTTKTKASKTSPQFKIDLYKEMLFYRRFEEKANAAYMKQKFSGFLHLHIGQEGVCVGVSRAMEKQDYMISGYRSHTQAISRGIPAREVLAELFGKAGGCSRGKGGSMHMFSKEHHFLGGHGIVGGQAPLAAGAAFALKYKDTNAITVCYLGDAAMNQGQVFEAMNMAATWELPVLFIIENNRYGMGTDIRRTTSIDHLYKRALAFDMGHSQIDGMDVLMVHQHATSIIANMRKDRKPHLLEALTYRYKGHSISDPGSYRSKDEVEAYQKKDPLIQLSKHLLEGGHCSEADLKTWDLEIRDEINAAEKFADESPAPDASETWMHVFAE